MQKMWLQRILKKSFLVALAFLFFNLQLYASVRSELKSIPYNDRFYINLLFKDGFLHDSLGHVLFFETKPACVTSFFIEHSYNQHFFEKQFEKGWKSWKKHEHLFPHPNFIFIEEKETEGKNKTLNIFTINKRALLHCLKQNEDIFKSILGNEFIAERFIERIENEKTLCPLIHHDELLLGIILGFGAESSKAFKEAHEKNETAPYPPWTDHYRGIDIQEPKNCLIYPIGFMGDPDSKEAQRLVTIYEQELKTLWEKYKSSGNTLEFILEQLCDSEQLEGHR